MREYPNPNPAAAFHMASHGNTRRFNLPSGEPTTFGSL